MAENQTALGVAFVRLRFGVAEARLAKLAPLGVQESDELYLIAAAGDNVKVRDALMDIKVLRAVNEDGLEQWTPVMKAEFPLPRPRRRRCSSHCVSRHLRHPVVASRSTNSWISSLRPVVRFAW